MVYKDLVDWFTRRQTRYGEGYISDLHKTFTLADSGNTLEFHDIHNFQGDLASLKIA